MLFAVLHFNFTLQMYMITKYLAIHSTLQNKIKIADNLFYI
jgi:hypothetical protein